MLDKENYRMKLQDDNLRDCVDEVLNRQTKKFDGYLYITFQECGADYKKANENQRIPANEQLPLMTVDNFSSDLFKWQFAN